MRNFLLALLFVVSLASFGHSAPPISTLMFSLSPDNNGAQTLISWSFTGPIKDSYAISGGSWQGVGSLFDGAFNSSYFTDSSNDRFTVANAGSLTDLTDSSSVQITQIGIGAYGSSRYIALFWGDSWLGKSGDQFQYTAGTDSYVINVPFTAFNVGTYTSTGMNLQGGMNFSAAVLPEPSALSLLAIGLGGLAFVRRRRP